MVQSIGQYGGSTDMFWYSPFDLKSSIEYCQLPMDEGGWGTTPRPEWIIEESIEQAPQATICAPTRLPLHLLTN